MTSGGMAAGRASAYSVLRALPVAEPDPLIACEVKARIVNALARLPSLTRQRQLAAIVRSRCPWFRSA